MSQKTEVIAYTYDGCPTLAEFAKSNAKIRGIVGPFGSGKSSASAIEIVRRGRQQKTLTDGLRRSRFAVVRNTMPQLKDTTIKTFFEWMPPAHFGTYHSSDQTYTINKWQGSEGISIEVLFRALDTPEDIGKLLSLDLTGAWGNEARELPWQVIEALEARLGRYPAQRDGGATWHGMWLDTNPPDVDSDWFKFFEESGATDDPTHAAIFHQPSGLSPQAENLANLPGGRAYYSNLVKGKSQAWIDVYVNGKYGFVQSGKPIFPEYDDRVHCQEIEPVPGIPIHRGWDWGLCYDDRTEVLTNGGWKFFKDVDVESDLIATRDPKTGAMEYAKAAFKVDEEFDGELLEWSSTEISMVVTPEHRVPFTFRDSPGVVHWQSAQWLADHPGGHHYVDLTSAWEPRSVSEVPFFSAETFGGFMGLYLSEGSVEAAKGRVTIYQAEPRPEMQAILDATGLTWRWSGSSWRTTAHDLAQYLAQFGHAHDKFVPDEIRHATAGIISAFLAAYTLGDGHVRTRENGAIEHTIYTTSQRMAGHLQELAQKVGWHSSANYERPQRSTIIEPEGPREIQNGGGWRITFKKRAKRAELLEANFRRVQYQGKVYCLNVPHHTLYVRRNGKPHWNGNTPACVFSQVLPDGRWLIFDELYSDNAGAESFAQSVMAYCAGSFQKRPTFIDTGDPAGAQRAQTDEKTVFNILRAMGIMIEPGLQSVALRLESIRKPLNTLIKGEPQFILHPRCKRLRRGFMGLYRYRRMKVQGERYDPVPEKNYVSHPMDAAQYSATRIFASELLLSREQQLSIQQQQELRETNALPSYFTEDDGYGGRGDDGRSDTTGY